MTVATDKIADRLVKEGLAVRPLPGQQERFLSCPADIALFGGVAGPGKSMCVLLEAIRHIHNPDFSAVIFRRTYTQITNPGGLWDTAAKIYRPLHAEPKQSTLEWLFPSGAKIKFAHMQYEDDRFQWDGAQIPYIVFDQLESFSERQFFYMLSRNRSMCGVHPYVRATANPDPISWLRHFIRWWIDDETGLAIKPRSGIIRWFVNMGIEDDDWADDKQVLVDRHGPDALPKSFTFIYGDIHENTFLMKKNPAYLANLQALPLIDRERLLNGNWNARETAGMFFHSDWFEIVDAAPVLERRVRYWDRAATEAKNGIEARGSHTAGVLMGVDKQGVFYVPDVVRFQGSPLKVEQTIKNVASQDGQNVGVGIEQDPGQAGKAEALLQVRNLAGYDVKANPVHEAKGVRARPVSAQSEAGNVKLVRGDWNDTFLRELENFDGSDKCKSDQVDAASGAFYLLTKKQKQAGVW